MPDNDSKNTNMVLFFYIYYFTFDYNYIYIYIYIYIWRHTDASFFWCAVIIRLFIFVLLRHTFLRLMILCRMRFTYYIFLSFLVWSLYTYFHCSCRGYCCTWSHSARARAHTHTHTHTHTHSVGLLWTVDRPVAETSTWQHTTFTTAATGIGLHIPKLRKITNKRTEGFIPLK
jgi:hypothetical protein